MTINQRNCGSDSRLVKALLEQVSGLQEDVAVLDSQIDDLSGTKANKADIAVSVSTGSLGANTATIGEGTVNRLHSSEVDTNGLHATETITNRLEVNGSADIANLKADYATITDAGTVNLTATRMVALEKIEVKEPGEGVQADVVLDRDTIKAPNVMADKVVAKVGEVTSVKSGNTVTDSLEVTGKTTVKDLDITGQITGLDNVDIDAKSIVTPIIEADEVVAGSIHTSTDNKLHPTPGLDNNDYYIITLPTFTGNIVLNWVDGSGNTIWSATATGNGKDYGFTWSTVSKDVIVVTDLYQYDKHLYIKTNVNGDLAYSYHTTEKLGEIGIGFNGVAGWTNPESLDDLVDWKYKHRCTVLDGTVIFGSSYLPGFILRLERIETEELIINGQDIVGTQTVKGSIDESLAYRVTQYTYDYSESAFIGRFYEVAPFMKSDQIPEGAKLIYNDNGTLRFTTSLPPYSGLQFGSPKSVAANKGWFDGIEWMPETVALADFEYSVPSIKAGKKREVATQEVQSFADHKGEAVDTLLDRKTAENASDIMSERARAQGAESTLRSSVDDERLRAQGAETLLQSNIDDETARAQSAETLLQSNIDAERVRAQGVEATKQDNLVSGTNIKTVNGQDILGSGNLKIDTLPEGGEVGQVLKSKGDGTAEWGWGFVPPVGMAVELRSDLNPNGMFPGEWVEI